MELSAYTLSIVRINPSSVVLIIDLIASVSPQALSAPLRISKRRRALSYDEPVAQMKGHIQLYITRIHTNSSGALRGVYHLTSIIPSHEILNI